MTDTMERPSGVAGAVADDLREFISVVLGPMHGWADISLASGVTEAGKLRVDQHHWFAYPAQLEDMVAFAARFADRDVYLSPIIYGDKKNGRGQIARTIENALASNTVYMDSDLCPPDRFRLEPTIHVDTSPGHGHDYWLLTEPIKAHEAADIAHRITVAHKLDGCDPSGWSANKVLRLPTVHTHPGDPVKITWTFNGELYDALDISGAYDDVDLRRPAPARPIGHAPAEDPDGLLSRERVLELMNTIPQAEHRLYDLLMKEPKGGESGWRSEHRYALMCELLRRGFDEHETASLVWYAPAGAKWRQDDARGVQGLWFEIRKAAGEIAVESGRAVAPAPARSAKAAGPRLLTADERRFFEERSDFLTLYNENARTKVPVFNRPLHDANAWIVLAVAYGATGVVPKLTGPMPCNLFTMQVSKSGTGKTEAARIMEAWVRGIYPRDDVFVPVNSSKNALIEHLLERDGSVALMVGAEAHGQFKEMASSPWTAGLQEQWTDIYDGEVSALGRVGKKDLRERARVSASMHMSGTPDEMFMYLTRDMFRSGYLARQVWVIGEEHEVTEATLRTQQAVGVQTDDWDPLPGYVQSVVGRGRAKIRNQAGMSPAPITMTEEALVRYDKAKVAMHRHFSSLTDADIFEPAMRRMFDIIWKAAALYAMSEERAHIQRNDVVVALGFAEVWLDTLMLVSERISATLFSKACDEIERFVASREGKTASAGDIYRRFSGERVRFVDEYLDSLTKQGRLYEPIVKADQERKFKIREKS